MKTSHQSILDAKKLGRTNWNCNLYLAKYLFHKEYLGTKNPAIKTKFLFKWQWHPRPSKEIFL